MDAAQRARTLQKTTEGLFAALLGIRFRAATPERIEAEMEVRADLCTLPGIGHGGALMAFADTLGAYGAALNLPEGASTTTLESKTNFFAPAKQGATLRGESTPLHVGGRTMVWQTRIHDRDTLLALVTQTQMVLRPRAAGG